MLWALGRARHGLPRLTRWSDVEPELKRLFAAHGLPGSTPTPEYPFVALHDGDFWEVDSLGVEVPAAHSSKARSWLTTHNPLGGLKPSVYEQLAVDDVARGAVVGALLNRYFGADPGDGLLRTVRLYSAAAGPATGWDLQVGDVVRRQVIHKRFGGQRQGGISTPVNSKFVLLFTDSTGSRYGYDYDGWKTDGSFHYTGQGQLGDQQFVATNRTVLERGREIHVFAEAARTIMRYVGQFKPDEDEPFYRADALDSDKQERSVIVFRLWPVDPVTKPSSQAIVAAQNRSSEVPLEAHNVSIFAANPAAGPSSAERREAALVQRYAAWLNQGGVSVVSNTIMLAGQSRRFRTDLYNKQTRELIEAKGTATRDHVRLALGQILDYARYVEHDGLAILLPVRPAEDLVELLARYGVDCIYEISPGEFDRASNAIGAGPA